MVIHGLNKLTLVDFPGQLSCTVFLGGCNFRCPFCHNGGLVLDPDMEPVVETEEFFRFLDKRAKTLDGIVISGGEPTLAPDLPLFIKDIKNYDLLVKLDTNGSNPDALSALLESKLVDYVAMDIKSSKKNYPQATGCKSVNLDAIEASVSCLMSSSIDYEFRTTVCKELHDEETFIQIADWIKGCLHYYLQSYQASPQVISILNSSDQLLSSYNQAELLHFKDVLCHLGVNADLRQI